MVNVEGQSNILDFVCVGDGNRRLVEGMAKSEFVEDIRISVR